MAGFMETSMPNLAFAAEIPLEERMKRAYFSYGQKVSGFFTSFKDAAIMIHELAMATKYRYDDLAEIYMEMIEDGDSADKAWEYLRDISLDYDW